FADLWRDVFALSHSRIADAMDKQLQAERIGEKETITPDEIGTVPDGAMISHGNLFYVLDKGKCWQWSGQGYKAANQPNKPVKLLTPPSIVKILQAGYRSEMHPSIKAQHGGS
ncbi:MAG: hypothetical protein AAF217_12615, partial [Pseudomonadota bacterium]